MPLTQANLVSSISWALAATNTPFGNTRQGPDSTFFNLNGLNLTTFDQIAVQQYTITSSSTQNVDCTSFTNLVNESFTFAHVLAIMVSPTDNQVTVAPGASNGLVWFFGGGTDSIIVPAGGTFVLSAAASATGTVVDGTHKIIALTASGGNVTVELVILGSTS